REHVLRLFNHQQVVVFVYDLYISFAFHTRLTFHVRRLYCHASHLPVAPHGRISPVELTGNPISSAVTVPPNLRWTDIFSMLPITVGDRPVVYELTIKNSGLSLSTSIHMVIRL